MKWIHKCVCQFCEVSWMTSNERANSRQPSAVVSHRVPPLIVNWRTHLKFRDEAKLSPEAKNLICKLLCNVEKRIGTKGAHEIKVMCGLTLLLVVTERD
ncbi:putative non-specific serine/threonine protein kinase [Helianthus annuus]|nr:putative non-specific serine/threonine protein kinase [Helianthus annuus]